MWSFNACAWLVWFGLYSRTLLDAAMNAAGKAEATAVQWAGKAEVPDEEWDGKAGFRN